MSIELTFAGDAQFEFAGPDHEVNSMGDLDRYTDAKCMVITSMDGEGVGILGSLKEIREFVRLMLRGLDIEIEEEEKQDAVLAGESPVVAVQDPDPEVAPEPVTGYELKTGHAKPGAVYRNPFMEIMSALPKDDGK